MLEHSQRGVTTGTPIDAILSKVLSEQQDDPERDAREANDKRRLEEFKQRLWRSRTLAIANVRPARAVFGELRTTAALKAVETWLQAGCKHDLVLRGGVGTGKTTAACRAVMSWCEPQVFLGPDGEPTEHANSTLPTVSWLRPNSLVSAIEHAYDPTAPKLHRFVVLEDLGRETRPEFSEAFTELLDRAGHTLLITTNMSRDEMRTRYDLRILERLNERAQAFDIPGSSMRPQGKF